jgi:hypothetical protein
LNAYWYYTLAVLFVVLNCAALAANLVALPGNWLIALFTALFWYFATSDERGLEWWSVAAVVVLAGLGELIEFAAGAAGAAKSGASRRSILLAMVGALAGSILGMAGLSIVPIVGTILGAVGGGALGAFGGAWIGEYWKGRETDQRMAAGKAAFVGRLLGTIGKLAVGAVMVAVSAFDAFVTFSSALPAAEPVASCLQTLIAC